MPKRTSPGPQPSGLTTVALDNHLLSRVKVFREKASHGELGRLSLRQALAAVVSAGLDAKGVP